MPTDFTRKPSANLERQIMECADPTALNELLRADLARQGLLHRTQEGTYFEAAGAVRQPEPQQVPLSASGYKFEREVRFSESSGRKTLVLRANSIEDLDALERQVTGQ